MHGDDLLALHEYVKTLGYDGIQYVDRKIQMMLDAKEYVREHGLTKTLAIQTLTEEVLPDNTPRALLIDTLRYKLSQLDAKTSLTIVDPYLFPSTVDPDLENDLLWLLDPFLKTCSQLTIISGTRTNQPFRAQVEARIRAQSSINLTLKISDVFHDRFWIADDQRGLFLGTSLNGIGKRYALVDYLQDQDATDIAQRVAAVP